jgi:hypothetical protein
MMVTSRLQKQDALAVAGVDELSGRDCDLIALAASRLPGMYQVSTEPAGNAFAWASASPAQTPGFKPVFSFCRYQSRVMLMILDGEGRKTVLASETILEAIGLMQAAFAGIPAIHPTSDQ